MLDKGRSAGLALALLAASPVSAGDDPGLRPLMPWPAQADGSPAVAEAAALAERHAAAVSTTTSYLESLTALLPPAEVVVLIAPAIRDLLRASAP
jgi:hypothetical protein